MIRLALLTFLVLGCVAAPQGAPDRGNTRPVIGQALPGVSHGIPAPSQPVAALPSASSDVSVPAALIGGVLAYVDPKYGPLYLALPFPRGTVATVCGPADCVLRRSTDFGPDQRVHPDRIADLSASDWVRVCGKPLSAGLCRGTVELEPPEHEADASMRAEDSGPRATLPPTDRSAR